MTWADGQAYKAAAYLERHTEDNGTGYVEVPGWAVAEAAQMLRDFDDELAKVREVNAEQAKHIERLMEDQRQAQQRMWVVRSGE
jgi:hypothetical protein